MFAVIHQQVGESDTIVGTDGESQCVVVVIVGCGVTPCCNSYIDTQNGIVTRDDNRRGDGPEFVGTVKVHRQSLATDGYIGTVCGIEGPS